MLLVVVVVVVVFLFLFNFFIALLCCFHLPFVLFCFFFCFYVKADAFLFSLP